MKRERRRIPLNTMGGRIMTRRKELGLTQQQLATRVGVAPLAVINWEQGHSQPRTNKLATLEDVLGVTVEWLLHGSAQAAAPNLLRDLNVEVKALAERIENAASATVTPMAGLIARMARFDNRPIRLMGQAHADDGDSRRYDFEAVEPSVSYVADAADTRCIRVRGQSAEELARDGQIIVVDAAVPNVNVGEACVVILSGGQALLKRKAREQDGLRHYQSINPSFPDLVIQPRQVLAEMPVVAVLIKPAAQAVATNFETYDEGLPPEIPPAHVLPQGVVIRQHGRIKLSEAIEAGKKKRRA